MRGGACHLGRWAKHRGAQWQARHPTAVYRWATSNTHYRVDVDSMTDVATLAAKTGVRLLWPADLVEA